MACPLATERVWIEKAKYHDAEKDYFEHLSKLLKGSFSNDKIEQVVDNKSTATSNISSNNINNVIDNMTMEEIVGDQPQVTKSKKTKKDKNKQAKQQQQQQQQQNDESKKNAVQEESSLHDDSVKTETSVTENSTSLNNDNKMNCVATNNDEESKAKKKKKKKNKASSEANNKVNENNQNNKVAANEGGNGGGPDTPTTTISNAATVAVNSNQGDDQKTQNNNKKNEAKHQRPTNIRNSKGSVLGSNQSTLVSEIAKARQHIKNSLEKMDGIAALAASPSASPGQDVVERFAALERENTTLRQMVEALKKSQSESEKRIKALETKLESLSLSPSQGGQSAAKKPTPAPAASKAKDDDDDDGVDLFASESEDEDAEASKIREQRLAEYAAKKSKKPALIAKSNVILDVKPWDDETDLKQMETEIRKITTDGLLWGTSKLVPVAFGIKKLTISCVVEDEKVSIDWLTEEIEKLEDYVQSVDIAAFNKI